LHSFLYIYVTEFGKTGHVHTRIEIHFIVFNNSHTQALSRHSDTIAIDKKVCFYRRLFANPIKPCRTNTYPVGQLGGINKVACGPKLFHSTSCGMVRVAKTCYGHLSGPLCTQLGRLCLLILLTHPPTPSTLPTTSHPPPYTERS